MYFQQHRFIMHATDGTKANIPATHIQNKDDFIEVYYEDTLIGMFDKGIVQFCYLSKEKQSKGA